MVQRVCYGEPVLYAGKSRQKYTALYDIPLCALCELCGELSS